MGVKERATALSHLVEAFAAGRAALAEQPFVPRRLELATTRFAQALVEAGDAAVTVAVSPRGLTCDEALVGAGPVAEGLAAPLVREGVKAAAFKADLALNEALPLAQAWLRTAAAPRGTAGVASRVWDTERAQVVLTLLPPVAALDEAAARDAEALARSWLNAAALPGQEPVPLSDERLEPALRALEALGSIPETGVPTAGGWVEGVEALKAGLSGSRRRAVEHLAEAAVRAADRARTQPEVDLLAGLLDRLARTLAQELRFAELMEAWRHAAPLPRAAGGKALLARFKAAVTSPALMGALVAALDAPETAGEALAGLKVMGAGAARSLLAAPALTADGKRRVTALLTELEGEARRASEQAQAQSAAASLEQLASLPGAEALALLRRALASPDAAMRRRALEVLPQEQAALLVELLHERVRDANPGVRLLAISHLGELEDPSAVPALLGQLQRAGVSAEERVRLYDALSRIGGVKAAAALVEALQTAEGALKVEVAKALGRVDHPRVKAALQAEAGRLLAPAALKAACREALAKLEGKAP